MKDARILARKFAYICILAVILPRAAAQELTGRVANTGLVSTAAVGEAQLFDGNSDTLFGKNTKGPYKLSWKPIDKNSEHVAVNGRMMQRGLDYEIDYAAGTLAFMEPMSSSAVIRVGYTFDPDKATKNTSGLSLPITLDVLKKENQSLQFTALYKQSGPNAQAGSDLAIFGLTGDRKTKEGQVSSLLLVSPSGPRQAGQHDVSLVDRSAMQFAGSTNTDNFQLTTSYSRIGEHFAGGKEYKLKPGSEVMDLAATYQASDALSLSSSMKRTEALGGAKKGQATTISTQKVVFAPDDAPKLTVSRTEVDKDKPDAAELKTVTDKIQLEHQLSPNIGAVATHQSVVAETGGTESRVTTDQLAVEAKPAENLSIKSVVTREDSSRTGEEMGVSLDMDAAPTKGLSVKAAVSRLDTDAGGRDTAESLKLVAAPTSDLNIEVSLAHRDSEAKGDELGHAVKVVSTPSSKLRLQIDWGDRDSQIKGDEQVGKFQVETTPIQAVTLSAAVGMRDTDLSRDLTREARLEVRPFGHTTLGGGYKEVETNGVVAAKVTDVSASTKPVGFLDLSGRYKLRQAVGQEDLDSVDLAMVLDTGGIFKFTGSYVSNPENKKGIVQRVNNQKMGLVSDLGRLKLRGGLTLKDDYLLGKRSEVTEVALDYQLSSHSLLTTSYKLDEYREESVLDTSVYALGYTRRIGSDFHLYLGGSMTTYEKDRALLKDQTEYEAEASLGVRF